MDWPARFVRPLAWRVSTRAWAISHRARKLRTKRVQFARQPVNAFKGAQELASQVIFKFPIRARSPRAQLIHFLREDRPRVAVPERSRPRGR